MTWKTLTLAIGAAIVTTAAAAQTQNCANRDTVVGKLETRYGESFSGGGLQNNQRIFEVWSSEEKGTWTILMTHANGTTCVMASGTNWRGGLPKVAEPAGIPG